MKKFSDKELIQENNSNLLILEQGVLKKMYTFEEIADILPGIVHINSMNDFAIRFINKYGQQKFDVPIEFIIAEGENFLKQIFEPGAIEVFSKPLIHMIKEDDDSKVVSFFQKVKPSKNSDFIWLLTTSKILRSSKEFISVSQEVSGINSSVRAIAKVLDDNLYLRINLKKFETLTIREKQILKLVAQGLTTNKVAERLFISPQTVKTHRKRIIQKLDLKKVTDWERFTHAFEL